MSSEHKWVALFTFSTETHQKQQPLLVHQTHSFSPPFFHVVSSFLHISVTPSSIPLVETWGSIPKFWDFWVTTFFCEPIYLGSVSSMMVMSENSSIFWCVDVLKWNHKVRAWNLFCFDIQVGKKGGRCAAYGSEVVFASFDIYMYLFNPYCFHLFIVMGCNVTWDWCI